jgi:putative flavoprotein involved in K+ transport
LITVPVLCCDVTNKQHPGSTPQDFDTVVIGGGQAGLAIGYYLAQQDRNFIIVDAGNRVGDAWRNRWESLRLFTQAQYSSLPGMPFPASDDYYPTKDEMADYLETYAAQFDLPVRLGTEVDTLTRKGDRYALEADSQHFRADHVVVATGPFTHPSIPAFAEELDPSITQLHSSEYRTPDQLPDGPVLVVGAGNSGAEIANELAASRDTFLSGRDVGSMPLSFFNNRAFWWLAGTVFAFDTWVGSKLKEGRQGQSDPLIRLTQEDLHRSGVERVPRTEDVVDGKPHVDDGRVLDVTTVVWATGFRPDFDWIDLPRPIFGTDGSPIHHRGVVDRAPGLYFLGLPDQHTFISATIGGVCTDARYIADHLRTKTDAETPRNEVTSEQRASCPTDIRYLLDF